MSRSNEAREAALWLPLRGLPAKTPVVMTTDRRLLSLLQPYRLRVGVAMACAAGAAAGMGSYAFLAGPALRALVQGDSLDVGPMLGKVLPAPLVALLSGGGPGDGGVLGSLPLLLIMAGLLKAAASAGFNILLPGAVAAAAADLRKLLYGRILRGDSSFFAARSTGDLVSRFTADLAAAEAAASQVAVTLVRDVSQALALVLVCALIDFRLMIAAVIVVPGTLIPVRRFASRLRGIGKEQLSALGEVSRRVEQALFGHRVVQAHGAEAFELAKLDEANAALLGVMRRSLFWRAAFTPVMEILGVLGLAAAIAYAGRAVVAGTLPPEAVISFAAAALMLFQPLKALGNLGQQLAQLRAAADRAFELLDTPNVVEEEPGLRELGAPTEVRLEKVSVRYGDQVALSEVDLTFRAGETVALVGESGAGKSTIAGLLLRFVEPSEGRVTFDGEDVREGTLRSLRAQVGFVPQETVVFAGTVSENVRCGAPLSEQQIQEAATAANAHLWIERLPKGYEQILAQGGGDLSGGERQRLGIARALARQARVLILDEATSALDAENDASLQEAFARALGGDRIGVMISHRLSSLGGVDRVVVLEQGRVVEDGDPAELLRAGGRFAALWALEAAA